MNDEIWELYTQDRVKTNQKMMRSEKIPSHLYHLAVHICLFNDRDEMLIQQRFKKRKTWSGLWDMSAGDSALMNETSYMTAEREVYEELGIQLSLKDIRLF